MRYLGAIITTLIGLFLVSTAAHAADTVNHIQVLVKDPEGNAIEGIPGTLYDGNESYVDYTASNSVGYLNYYSITDGTTYTIQLRPGQAYGCSNCALYEAQDISFTASASEAVLDEATGLYKQTLDDISLVQASRYITVTVVDQNGAPVEGLYVSGWTNSGDWAYGITNENGQYAFAVDTDSTADWNFGAYPDSTVGGYTSSYEYDIEVAEIGETAVSLSVTAADATIDVSLKQSDGSDFTVPESSYASVSCYDTATYQYYFYASIDPGESNASVGVVGGYDYQCSLWLEGYGSSSATVTAVAGETVDTDLTLLDRDAELTFQYVGTDGNVLTDVDSFSAYAFSTKDAEGNENYSDYAYANGAAGEATMNLVDGYTYQVSGYIYDSESGISVFAGTTYINTYTSNEVVADKDNPQTVQVELQEADATIDVTVLNSEGEAASYAYVYAIEETGEEESGTWGAYIGASTDSEGVGSLGVASGKTYTVYAYTNDSYMNGVMPPPAQTATPAAGETVTLTMQSVQSDYALSLTTELNQTEALEEGDVGAFEYTYCYAYSPHLATYTFADLSGSTGNMDLVSGYKWWIGCMSYQNDDFYRSVDTVHNPAAGETAGEMIITMQSAGAYYPETTYSFSATSANTITLPDGMSTLVVPANAIDDSGMVTLIVNTGTGYMVNDSMFPVTVYEFKALDSSGNEVTEFNSNLTLNLWYDAEFLAEHGVAEEDLVGSAYNDSNKQWEAPVSTELDTENDMLIITLSHFSMYGGVGKSAAVDDSVDAPSKPTNLKAKKIKAKSALLTWKKPIGTVSKYKVQVRKFGVKKAAKWNKYNSVKRVKKTVRKLKADTQYQFRVRACNSGSCSAFTKWKAFKTKG